MGNKFCFYKIPMELDEVYQLSLKFWNQKGGEIVEEGKKDDIHFLKIQRGVSLTSNGESYKIQFKFNKYDSNTYIATEVSLSFGYGIQWLTPLKFIKNWANNMNHNGSINFTRKGNVEAFFDFKEIYKPPPSKVSQITPLRDQNSLEDVPSYFKRNSETPSTSKIQEISKQEQKKSIKRPINPNKANGVKFCTNCGTKSKLEYKFCKMCGFRFEE